ncbi:MAG TPA: undecaprenyl-diphosphate phosphatase [Vicinamibacterales bacterium]|nr:undecaprenyl-diphosphate phosphatase [Vicinamibacterales bacterium]
MLIVAALLGTLQGLTEFLPISSTAHLLIAGRLLRYEDPGEAFTVMIQLGSILAVMWLYRAKLLSVATGLTSSADARRFALMILAAFVPALLAGPLLNDYVDRVLSESLTVIAVASILGGIVMLAVEARPRKPVVAQADKTPLGRALGIGLCQTLALVPGVSRSGATIVGARLLGLDRAAAAEFSFFLAMPTMTAAFVYKLVDVRAFLTAGRALEIGVGFLFAFLAALAVVKPFLAFVSRAGFAPFAWYRIVAGLLVLAAIAAGAL